MSDIHPLSGSSYPEMAQSNPLDVSNHPDTLMPDGNNKFAQAYAEAKSASKLTDSMNFYGALSKLGVKK
jgi:hypothetical protein